MTKQDKISNIPRDNTEYVGCDLKRNKKRTITHNR